MKSHSEVQKTRQSYHREPAKKAVHRSSLLVPELDGATASISFLNHFLLKRNYDDVACKITGVDADGRLVNAVTVAISEPRVYSIVPSELLGQRANMYVVEFFCASNLFVPFPAAMINHEGENFLNSVHSYNRVFNDVFENDAINAINVPEASIDVELDDGYEPFFVFSSGILPFKDKIPVRLDGPGRSEIRDFAVEIPKLAHSTVALGDAFRKPGAPPAKFMRIEQPPQFMFYGRLLVGTRDLSTGAFSANHSYYDSSKVNEYWPNPDPSFRTYPVIPGFGVAIRMYPIMSPGTLRVSIDARNSRTGKSHNLYTGELTSPGSGHLDVDVSKLLSEASIETTAISVSATPAAGNTPTRISHQIVYYDRDSRSRLQASINVSLATPNTFQPAGKTSQSWGQIMLGRHYRSGMGLAFNKPSGEPCEVKIEFYCAQGKFLEKSLSLSPGGSWCITGEALLDALSSSGHDAADVEPIWYFARSPRGDLTGFMAQSHLQSGHTSGEHSF